MTRPPRPHDPFVIDAADLPEADAAGPADAPLISPITLPKSSIQARS